MPNSECIEVFDEWTPRIHIADKFADLLSLATHPDFHDFVEGFEKPNDSSRSKIFEIKVFSDPDTTALAQEIQRLSRCALRGTACDA